MSDEQRKGADVRFPPPLLFLSVLLVGLLLGWLVPLLLWPGSSVRVALGIAVALAGLGLIIASLTLFRSTGQNPTPWSPTPKLIIVGPYRFTRNPIYLGMVAIDIGIGIALGNLWIPLLTVGAGWLIERAVIIPEEVYLEGQFGDAYREYKRTVRRWI